MEIHFIDVGCGNMTLLRFPTGVTWLYDCNVTDDNEDAVLGYLHRILGNSGEIGVFICSHRDADHTRGIKKIHDKFPIGKIRDNDVEGTTTDSSEYREYMDLRRDLPFEIIEQRKYQEFGEVLVRWMHAKNDDFSDANDQSVVMKIEYKGYSVLLAGDTSYRS
jgi:beta-lactamase superfamily II metal-dependent hydrolase